MVVEQRGAERVTTPNPAGLAGVTVGEDALPGGPAVGLAQAAPNGTSPSTTTVSSNALRPQVITGARHR